MIEGDPEESEINLLYFLRGGYRAYLFNQSARSDRQGVKSIETGNLSVRSAPSVRSQLQTLPVSLILGQLGTPAPPPNSVS